MSEFEWDLKSLTLDELQDAFVAMGEKPFRAKQVFEWYHKKLVSTYEEMKNISKTIQEKMRQNYEEYPVTLVEKYVSKLDSTTKFLFRLADGHLIESVWMQYKHGNSVCISSQVGCRMGCKFCASTLDGLERNLLPSEMLSQVYEIQKIMGARVSNVVIMGSGEPFDNFKNVERFLKLITEEQGLCIGQRGITVSTCGLVPEIKRFTELNTQVNLAISLHASNDEQRKALMPIANRYSIREIMEAVQYYIQKTNRRVTFEYSLVKGENDSPKEAHALADLLSGMLCHVNLIPVNPIKERDYKQSEQDSILKFKNVLEKNHINVTIRREMGRDIKAACGQLRRDYKEK